MKQPAAPEAILDACFWRYNQRRLHTRKEQLIAGTIVEFQDNDTTLTRKLVLKISHALVQTLSHDPRQRI